MFKKLLHSLRALFRKERAERELDEEVRFHLEKEIEANLKRGMSAEEARRVAIRSFGGVEQIKEECRDARGVRFIETLGQDLRYAVRMLLKNPGFTLVAALTLALGIGANSAIFSGVSAFILRPLPVDNPDQIVTLFQVQSGDDEFHDFSYPDYIDYRDQSGIFDGLLGHWLIQAALSNDNRNDVIWGEVVTGNYFDVLRVHPFLGRGFLPEEDKTPGSHPVVVIGYNLWQHRFASDPGIVGKTIALNGHPFTVVGVAPREFTGAHFALSMDFWVPVMMRPQLEPNGAPLDDRSRRSLTLIGRLKPGVTLEQAEAAMTTISRRLLQAYPTVEMKNSRIVVLPETKGRFEDASSLVMFGAGLAMGVVGVVLLIACANVANLLLARAVARRREIGIRLALGASRARLIRQLLTESVLLSVMGGSLGLLFAYWATALMQGFIPVLPFTVSFSFSPDRRALAFTLIVSLLTGIVFGLAPALQGSNPDVVPVLKGETLAPAPGSRRFTLRNLLVVSQIALSLVVLVCGGLFVKSFQHAKTIDPGFNPENVLAVSVNPGLLGYTEAQGEEFYRQLVERVGALPGVRSASVASVLPLSQDSISKGPVLLEGEEQPPDTEGRTILANIVGPKHFETLQTPLVQGRDFSEHDRKGAPGVVIVNETLARRFWPGQNPLGKRLRIGGGDAQYLQVIGVARNGQYNFLGESPKSFLYLPHLQNYDPDMTLLVRTAGDPRSMVNSIRQAVQALDRRVPIYEVKTLKEHMTYALWSARMASTLSIAFGLLALLLAATGIYSVIAYSVSQRTREIGIRMALGAQKGQVFRLITRQGMVLTLVGVAIGLMMALPATRVLSSLLYGVSATDAATFTGVPLLLAAVAMFACYIPARRATKVDPLVALRYE